MIHQARNKDGSDKSDPYKRIKDDIKLEKIKSYIRAREERFGSKIEIPIGDVLLSRKCIVRKKGKLLLLLLK